MPDRWAGRCSTVTSSPISGRSAPSTQRAVVDRRSAPSLIKLTTVSAVSPLVPLAIANRVATVFGIWQARSARPYAPANSVAPPRSTDTTPLNPACSATGPIASDQDSTPGAYSRAGRGSQAGRLVLRATAGSVLRWQRCRARREPQEVAFEHGRHEQLAVAVVVEEHGDVPAVVTLYRALAPSG